MRLLHWFQNDLRVEGNPALGALPQSAHTLLCVYLLPKPRAWCNLTGIGPQRDRFLRESLQSLKHSLQEQGQDLMVLEGSPELVLPTLVQRYNIDRVTTCFVPGFYEKKALEYLHKKLETDLQVLPGNSLFTPEEFPFSQENFPKTFSPFRRKVEKSPIIRPSLEDKALPPPPSGQFDEIPLPTARANPALPIPGGRPAGVRRLEQFLFNEHRIDSYKATRNCLDGLSGSSTLSPWIANGCLGVREVAHAIFRYERECVKNESTYWLYFELLWREFFYWRAVSDDSALFKLGGPQGKHLLTSFEPRSFARWCAGDTNSPIVNACMRQLLATGWMSNRGRQIVASCLVNELGIDWRFGAAFFEQQLIDYDVGSNYGNWQYIAGVGSDPRGGRHFNLARQTEQFDPDGTFTKKWQGHRQVQPVHIVDGADWPILEPS